MKHEWPLLASSLVLVGLLAAGPLSAGPTPSSLAAAALAGDSIVHDDFSVTTYRPGPSAGETFVVCWTIAPKPFMPIGFVLVQVPNSSASVWIVCPRSSLGPQANVDRVSLGVKSICFKGC